MAGDSPEKKEGDEEDEKKEGDEEDEKKEEYRILKKFFMELSGSLTTQHGTV